MVEQGSPPELLKKFNLGLKSSVEAFGVSSILTSPANFDVNRELV
jgi:hypothetical protein